MKEHIETENIKGILENTPFSNYTIEEVDEGVSTNVFKLEDSEIFYLKLLSDNHPLQPFLLANKLLLEQEVKLPEIQYFTEKDGFLDNRKFYIEKEIEGKSIKKDSTLPEEVKEKLIMEAGKDLAKINTIPVEGVGWIEGVKDGKLFSSGKDYNDFILRNIGNMLNGLSEINVLSSKQIKEIESYIVNNQTLFDTKNTSYLAHGDFCVKHIYHLNGEYSGIIDFGDIRGTSKYHDLAHFYTFNRKYFEALVEGYNSIYKLPSDYMNKVTSEAVIFGVGKLWWISKNMPNKLKNHPVLDLFDEIVY